MVLLQPGPGGQKDIRKLCRGSEEEINHSEKLDLLQCLVSLFGIGPGDHRIASAKNPGFQGIGLAGQDGIPGLFGVDQRNSGTKLELITAQPFFLLLRRKIPVP